MFFHDFIGRIPGIRELLQFLDRKGKGVYTRAVQAIMLYRNNAMVLLRWILLSTFVMFPLLAGSLTWLMAGIASPEEMPAGHVCLLASYMGQTAAVLPLTPSGIGTRDLASAEVFKAAGCAQDVSVLAPLAYTAILLLVSLSGALFFVFDPYSGAERDKGSREETGNPPPAGNA